MKRTIVVAALAALLIPAGALAGAVNYYGFNYLSPTLPNDKCAPYQGRACSGFNYWTYSEVDKNSGDWIRVGYQPSGGDFSNYVAFGSGWNGWTVGTSSYGYNRGFCMYDSGNSSYVRCRTGN